MIKDLQSHESKVVFVLYFECTSTPHKYILQTLRSILQEAAELRLETTMITEVDGEETATPIIPDISIRSQVPRLKGVDVKDFDKLPWHVKQNRKALHVEAKPEDNQELTELVQLAKEVGLVDLRLGKRAHISEVMDNDSTSGEIKTMVKFAIKHANLPRIDDGRNDHRNRSSGWGGVAHGRRRSGGFKDGPAELSEDER